MNITSLSSIVISSYRTSIILMLIFATSLGIATFVEKFYGTEVAKIFFYYSPLMILIQFLMVVNFLAVSARYQLFSNKKIPFLIIHFAFIIILAGAFVTHLFGEEGTIHLRENEETNKMFIETNKGHYFRQLPFTIELKEFILTRYPGSSSPSAFESIVNINENNIERTENISMNNVLDIKGYRLFQASYDTDEKGTILSVNKDVSGRIISYAGYFLLTIGFILCLIMRNTRFHFLINQLKTLKSSRISMLLIFSLFYLLPVEANPEFDVYTILQTHRIPIEHAEKFGALPMQASNGRIKPINTFSSEVLRKLHHSDRVGELNSDQFLTSLLAFPEMWMKVPFIYYKNKEITSRFDLTEKMCSYSELFDSNGLYKLQRQVEISHAKSPASRTKFDKDIIKLDEQINIFHQLTAHRLLNVFPKKDDPNRKWYASGDDLSSFSPQDSIYIVNFMSQYSRSLQTSLKSKNWAQSDEILQIIANFQVNNNTTLDLNSQKTEAELLFNRMNVFQHCKKAYLILGGLLVILAFVSYFREKKWIKYVSNILSALVIVSLLFHIFGLALRGYIGGYAPWSNSYETMIYISLISIFAGLIFLKQSRVTFALATLFAGIILFVSGLNWMDPQINMLVPVLKSPWLMIHVAVIVAAYSFFGISCLLGITNLVILLLNKKDKLLIRVRELSIINEMSLLIGLALMTIGTFLGAVWANESWGRYWGWDSKETWALITILVYAVATHLRLVKRWDNPLLFNIASVLAFLAVLMTYFGVNYFLTGLHSYG